MNSKKCFFVVLLVITFLVWAAGALSVSADDPIYIAYTPGFWKNHTNASPSGYNAWPWTGHEPTDSLCYGSDLGQGGGDDLFSAACGEPYLDPVEGDPIYQKTTMIEALSLHGGPGAIGATGILLREGITALLNANINANLYGLYDGFGFFPVTHQEVLDMVNAALASGDRDVMLDLAGMLKDFNDAGKVT